MAISRRRKVLFALIPTVVLLVVVELVARVVCHVRFAPFGTGIAIQGKGRMISDPVAVFGNRPRYLEFDRSGQYNDLGIRVPPGRGLAVPPHDDEELLVLLLGGSAMAGMGSVHVGEWMEITGVAAHDTAHSIDGYLETFLAHAMPDRRVRVLNAAVNCATLLQSRLHYQRLRHLRPDWVVAMDGYNDPRALASGESSEEWIRNFWNNFHYHRFPYRQARWIMPRSAAGFLLGEFLFYQVGVTSHTHNTVRNPEVVARWLGEETALEPPVHERDPGLERALAAYESTVLSFHGVLEEDRVRHLLLVQPEITARLRNRIDDPVEMAVYNYTLHAWHGRADRFMASLEQRVEDLGVPELRSMTAVHGWRGWVFVDYCHFTADANRRIAEEIGRTILSNGSYRPFR